MTSYLSPGTPVLEPVLLGCNFCNVLLRARCVIVHAAPPRVPSTYTLPVNFALKFAQAKFTADQHPQYIYSPRELSRWVRALYEAMNPLDAMTLDELVRLWANEALRLFHDRLVTQDERDWCQEKVRLPTMDSC